jgi:hypothetical protein
MKKHLLLAALVLSGVCLQAQLAWFQIGTEWTYEMYIGWNPATGLYRMVIEKEVELGDGNLWMRFRRYHIESNSSTALYFARQEGDKVWVGPGTQILVYDFSLRPGDTLFFGTWRHYAVLDTGSVLMAGQIRRTQTIAHSDLNYPLLLVEGIGPVGNPDEPNNPYFCSFFFLNADFCHAPLDGTTAYFRCFADMNGSYSPFETCLVNADAVDAHDSVQFWPNPANDRLFVQGNCRALQLCDALGRVVLEEKMLTGDMAEIRTSHLANGMYLLLCHFADGQVAVRKVVFSR